MRFDLLGGLFRFMAVGLEEGSFHTGGLPIGQQEAAAVDGFFRYLLAV